MRMSSGRRVRRALPPPPHKALAQPHFAGILFTMHGHNFTALAAALLVTLASSALSLAAGPGGQHGIPGADPAEVKQCGKDTAYVYPAYVVYTSKSPYFEGQDIYVFKPRAPVSDPCSLATRAAYYTINAGEFGGSHTFRGMHGDYMFVDEWPGEDNKRLLIIDAGKKSLVYFDWYADPVIEGGTLRYSRVLRAGRKAKEEAPCPDAEKWEKEGSIVLYAEKMTLDLATMKETHSDQFFCEPGKPVNKGKGEEH